MSWHKRQIHFEHYQRFEQLLELHQITAAWIHELKEVGKDRPSHALDRGLPREITDQLWMLESLGREGLESLLDDTSTTDVLSRLERTIWSVQGYTLAKFQERTQGVEAKAALKSILEQTCWRLGRNYAEKRWSELPSTTRGSMAQLSLTLNDTPFGNGPDHQCGLLTIRVTEREANFERLQCPHRQAHSEVSNVADSLCNLHFHWIKGFAYGLNPGIKSDSTPSGSDHPVAPIARCRIHWTLSNPNGAGQSLALQL
jgi:hypothetical protein